MVWPARNVLLSPSGQEAMAGADLWGMKLVPSLSMQCNTTASLRASATRAFLGPARLATASAQLFKCEAFTERVSMTLAAS